jgi:hypothetical protein
MSRSIKNKYFLSHACCQSEKKDKKRWHKIFRKKEQQNINSADLEEYVTTYHKEVNNPWDMGKDGKHYYSPNDLLASIKEIAKRSYKNKKRSL